MRTLTLSPAAAQRLAMMLEDHADALDRTLRRRFWWPMRDRSKDLFYAQELKLFQGLLEQLRENVQNDNAKTNRQRL